MSSRLDEAALSLDPITQEVITEGLAATMAEMRANVMRAAYSAVIAVMQDFSCGLFNPAGEMIAQGPDHPGHIVPLPWGVRSCMEDLGDDLRPGDVVILNDPYRGGTHLNDVTVLWPVFVDGDLFCFPAVRAHWADVGGISPGSYSGEATNIFYEGIRIPPIKIFEQGRLNESVFRLLMTNVRLPEEREGDFRACVGACRVGERRIREMTERYGKDVLLEAVDTNLDRDERRLRWLIGELPDGEYYAEDYIEFFTKGVLDPGRVALRLEVDGDRVVADFRQSSKQLAGVANSTAAVTLAGVIIAVKSALDPGGAITAGTFRPIECKTTPGTITDVAFDAPANAHGEIRKRIVGVTLAALAQAAPDRVSGDLCGTSYPNVIGGWDDLRGWPFVYLAVPAGGNGGVEGADGPNAMGNVDMGNLPACYPAEEQESIYPLVVEEVGLRPDSEGAGRFRGGTGARMRVRLLARAAEYSLTCDRAIVPPWGTLGGTSAAPVYNVFEAGDGAVDGKRLAFHLGKVSSFPLRRNDVVVLHAAGGGGYGHPLDRSPLMVLDDVLDDYISRERAYSVYGVVIDDRGGVDEAATEQRRAELRKGTVHCEVVESEHDSYTGINGRHRIQRLAPACMTRLVVEEGDLVELTTYRSAALRAWVRADPALDARVAPLDAAGMWMLDVRPGESVEIRVPATANDANDIRVRAGRTHPVR